MRSDFCDGRGGGIAYSSIWKLLDPTARVEVCWQVQPRGVSAQSEVELRSKRESDKSSLHLILLPVIHLLNLHIEHTYT